MIHNYDHSFISKNKPNISQFICDYLSSNEVYHLGICGALVLSCGPFP